MWSDPVAVGMGFLIFSLGCVVLAFARGVWHEFD